ncbi:MAG: signal recognition particle-docking protein FtsY [Propionibacteriaceae bacterium]|nr:signal recognition particle-docking protein FtsY [Propionibacteriaceae bacterium]
MDWLIFWIVAGVVVAALIAATVVILGSRRRQRALAQSQAAPPLAGPGPTEAPGTAPAASAIAPDARDAAPVASARPALAAASDGAAAPAAPASGSDKPEAPRSRLGRLRRRLASSDNALARGLASLLASDRLSEETWEDFEATLITSDLGVGPAGELVGHLRKRLAIDGVADAATAKAILRDELIALVNPGLDRRLRAAGPADGSQPGVILVVGVNGTGKTTTVGKLARLLVADGQSVVLGAADTFRAAAADQLQTWGDRIGVETVRGAERADPASVAYDAARQAQQAGADVLIVDTAGRLHTKVGLMDELGKVKRVIEKVAPVTETLLVLDATTGQNGLVQAKIFAETVDITGVVLTKLDGSAKGGIVVAVQRQLDVPVKFIGLGEGADDLAPFDAAQFVDGLLGD